MIPVPMLGHSPGGGACTPMGSTSSVPILPACVDVASPRGPMLPGTPPVPLATYERCFLEAAGVMEAAPLGSIGDPLGVSYAIQGPSQSGAFSSSATYYEKRITEG